MDDTVGHCRAEEPIREGHRLGIHFLQREASRKVGPGHVAATHGQHLLGKIDRQNADGGVLPAYLDRNQRRAAADIEHRTAAVPAAKKSAAKTRLTSAWSMAS